VHNAHHVSSTAEEKAPPGHYREHTSRSILDIQGLASQRSLKYTCKSHSESETTYESSQSRLIIKGTSGSYKRAPAMGFTTAWFAVDLVSRSTFGKSKWAGLKCIRLARDKGGLMAAMFESWF
jgi:hypothetical protein